MLAKEIDLYTSFEPSRCGSVFNKLIKCLSITQFNNKKINMNHRSICVTVIQ